MKKEYHGSHCYLVKSDVPFICLCSLDFAASVVVYEFSSVGFAWIKILFSTMDFFTQTNTLVLDNSN